MIRLNGPEIKMPGDCVCTVGKFESIHTGHQFLINEAVRLARESERFSAVVTFAPHPRTFIQSNSYLPMFTPRERAYILNSLQVDYMLEIPFDRAFMELSPDGFCSFLFGPLRCKTLVVGEGFRFGKDRAGSVSYLRKAVHAYGARLVETPRLTRSNAPLGTGFERNDNAISTSAIRKTIGDAHMREAAECLGFPYFIIGDVRPGKQIGRTLGFPTVNVQAENRFLPPDGVYATRTRVMADNSRPEFDGRENFSGASVFGDGGQRSGVLEEKVYRSVTNIGIRPTVEKSGSPAHRTVESFLLDFDGELYGRELMTEFIGYLRPERKFNNLAELREQIERDVAAATVEFGAAVLSRYFIR
jgi:riboflavin kinase/FMN adenylyltransferase